MNKEIRNIDIVIIGGGPAGISAAIYASRAKINTVLLENQIPGGQIRSSYSIDNYPGFISIEGNRLADLMVEQAKNSGVVIDEFDQIVDINFSNKYKNIETEKYLYVAKSVIIATGAVPRKLPISNEERFRGKGVHYCAVCDGAIYSGGVIGVVGGGNSALEEALFLSRYARKVIMIRRHDYFNGEESAVDEVLKNPNIEIMYKWNLIDVMGDNFVDRALITNVVSGEKKEIQLDAVFGCIGTEPNTELFEGYIELDDRKYIVTDETMETNIKGVYAAGDVRQKRFRQITTAVADGTIAALSAEKYLYNL